MASLVLNGNTSGSVTISSPSVSGTTTLTLPTTSGTVLTNASTTVYPKGGPTFGASQTNAQTISRTTFTKLQYNVEDWDTASCYDNATNYRFTPNVAGYYQIFARTQFTTDATARDETFISFYKNGSEYKRSGSFGGPTNSTSSPGGSVIVYLNGSSDYVEVYIYYAGGSATSALNINALVSCFQGCLIRAD